MRDVLHDLSPIGECSEENVVERVNNHFIYCNAVMNTSFYRDFTKYLTQIGVMERHQYKDLSLNDPVRLDQPTTRLTQSLFNQGGLVSPSKFQFYLMKIQTLYWTTQVQDDQRLQQAHTYLDICQYFYQYRSTIRILLREFSRESTSKRELGYKKFLELCRALERLLLDL